MADLSGIVLNPKDYLVERVSDYFAPKDDEFSTRIVETMPVDVGIIKSVGSDLPQKYVGKTIYYKTDLSDKIEIKGIGNYEIVADPHKYLIRMDEELTNN